MLNNTKYCMIIPANNSNLSCLYHGFKDENEMFRLIEINSPWEDEVRVIEGLNNKEDYYRRFLTNKVSNESNCQYVFIIYARIMEWYDVDISQIIRDEYQNVTLICYYGDLVIKHNIDINKLKSTFDYILTFDRNEAMKYDLNFCQEPLSGIRLKKYYNIKYDVAYVGRGGDRYKDIISVYKFLNACGLKCVFYIFDVPKFMQEDLNGIFYNKWLDYDELIELESNSKCILELVQANGYSPTTRFAEAMLLEKNLVTNCLELKKMDIPGVIWFDDVNKIDFCRITKRYNRTDMRNLFSIKTMIRTIDSIIKK